MDSGIELENPALQDCINLVNESLKIIHSDSPKYYMKDALEVSKEVVAEVGKSLVAVSILLNKFRKCWVDSKRSGPDAILTSDKLFERIDMKLVRTGKLDFEQFRKIMVRMNRADDVLLGLNRISLYTHSFRIVCSENFLNVEARAVDVFIEGVLNQAIDGVKSDAERYANQIDRCNLYFQNVLKSRTFKVAIGSLFVSSLAVLLTILINILPHILKLLGRG